jgi:hypothetical protein
MREIYGVSDKVLAMALSCLLLGAPKKMGLWIEVGGSMIAIDTLVHNLLHRTGILARFNANHLYGAACYRPGGCADIIAAVLAAHSCQGFMEIAKIAKPTVETSEIRLNVEKFVWWSPEK